MHDLKNPIITIPGYSKRIRERKGDIDNASEAVIDSAQNMEKIAHDVLDFAKPVNLDLKEQDIGNIIVRVRNSCGTKADEKGVILSTYLPSEPVNLPVDSFHLERALINLINNAIEVSKKGERVEVRSEIKDNRFIVIIKTFGPGMDRKTLESVFIPFYTKKSSGTGLGMAIAKKIIDGHQGKIYIESREQTGTVVIIELPLRVTQ